MSKQLKKLHKTEFSTVAFSFNGTEITGFLSGENTIENYDPRIKESERVPRAYGFEIEETGGGCTAWMQDFDLDGVRVRMMITDTDGLSHKVHPADRMLVGLYNPSPDAPGEALILWEQDNFPLDANNNRPDIQTQFPAPEKQR